MVRLRGPFIAHVREHFLGSLPRAVHVQHELLLSILRAHAGTWFGVQHNFAKIKTVQEYQAAVPLCSYEDIRELIDRIAAGEQGVLTRARVRSLQLTSGSTQGQQKLIPSTIMYQYKAWMPLLAWQGFLHQWALAQGIQQGPGLLLVNTLLAGNTKAGIPYGPASTNFASSSRHAWPWLSVTPYEATQVADSEARRYVSWRFALHSEKLAYIGSPYMTPLLTFAATLFHRSNELIRDIADGTLSANLPISLSQRGLLTGKLRPDRQRALQLEHLALQAGGLLPRAIWPALEWIFAVYGLSFQSYEAQLAHWYCHKHIWGMPYLASEGIISIPWSADSYSHLPVIKTSFLEFIPEDEWSNTHPRTCLVTELETDHRYDVVLTGWNGMYRYQLGDVIEVDGSLCGVPTFKIVSRRSGILSVVWEKTTEAQVVAAVTACAAECSVTFTDFVVDIDRAAVPARYRLWAELSRGNLDLKQAPSILDRHLKSANPIYNLLRNGDEIGLPVVRLLPMGTFERYRQHRELQGAPAEQLKVLHTVPEWNYAASLTR